MKKALFTLAGVIFMLPSFSQSRKLYVTSFAGVAAFKTTVTPIEGNLFQSSTVLSAAPAGFGLSIECLKNTFIDLHVGTQSLHRNHLRVVGDNFGLSRSGTLLKATNLGIKLKYELKLVKGLKFNPFIGYSTSFLNQNSGHAAPLKMISKGQSTATVNGVETDVKRDSLFASGMALENVSSGLSFGGELAYDFQNRFGLYMAYTFFYNNTYYAQQYGEFRSTYTPTQKAITAYGKSGHFFQLGLRYHLFNIQSPSKAIATAH